jgi:hypothetical protein
MSEINFSFAHADPSFFNTVGDSDDQGMNILWKVLNLVLILVITLIFGLMPSYWYNKE